MSSIILDTLEYATKLKAGGFTEQQAETQARAIADIVEKQLATRQDVATHEAMIRDIKETFKEKLYECHKHVEKITVSKKHLTSLMPLSAESYLNLNDVDMSFIDQLIFRFSKLQDTLGEKVFPFILDLDHFR